MQAITTDNIPTIVTSPLNLPATFGRRVSIADPLLCAIDPVLVSAVTLADVVAASLPTTVSVWYSISFIGEAEFGTVYVCGGLIVRENLVNKASDCVIEHVPVVAKGDPVNVQALRRELLSFS